MPHYHMSKANFLSVGLMWWRCYSSSSVAVPYPSLIDEWCGVVPHASHRWYHRANTSKCRLPVIAGGSPKGLIHSLFANPSPVLIGGSVDLFPARATQTGVIYQLGAYPETYYLPQPDPNSLFSTFSLSKLAPRLLQMKVNVGPWAFTV